MSSAQVSKVQSNWATFAQDLDTNGCAIFKAFFAKYPAYKAKFSAFKDVDPSAFQSTPKALAHVRTVLTQLGEVVSALGNSSLDGILQDMAEKHTPRNVKGQQFDEINEVIINYLAGVLGGSFDKAAWQACLGAMSDGISKYQ